MSTTPNDDAPLDGSSKGEQESKEPSNDQANSVCTGSSTIWLARGPPTPGFVRYVTETTSD